MSNMYSGAPNKNQKGFYLLLCPFT